MNREKAMEEREKLLATREAEAKRFDGLKPTAELKEQIEYDPSGLSRLSAVIPMSSSSSCFTSSLATRLRTSLKSLPATLTRSGKLLASSASSHKRNVQRVSSRTSIRCARCS